MLPGHETLLQLLSTPGDEDEVRHAAKELIEHPDASSRIERLYPALIRHKTLLVAIGHLADAGAELDSFSISGATFRSEWPFSLVFAGTRQTHLDRVSLTDLRRLARTHEELLAGLEYELAIVAPTSILLFGRAIRAAFPAYRHGMSHDVDLFIPSGGEAAPLLEHLCAERRFAILRMGTSREGPRHLAHFKLYTMSVEGHYLSIDLLCGGRPARALHRPFAPDLETRARSVVRDGRALRVPCREDLLLMLVEKTHRRAEFIRRHFNDAGFLLTCVDEPLDWDHVMRSARRHGIDAVLHYFLASAPEDARVPKEVLGELAPSRSERRMIAMMMPTPGTSASGPRTSPTGGGTIRRWRVWQAYWFTRYLAEAARTPRDAVRIIGNVARSALLSWNVKRAGTAVERAVKELGPAPSLRLRSSVAVDFQRRGMQLAIERTDADGRARTRRVP